jgi:hypothetical protein
MIKKFIAGGCSFTLGNELSDDVDGKTLSKKTWSYGLFENSRKDANTEYKCTASGGSGNSGIARRVFNALSHNESIDGVVIMWSFLSRYDWAMPRHKLLEDTRWTSVSPWDTNSGNEEAFRTMQGSETQQEHWRARNDLFVETGVKPFAEAIYKPVS